MNDVRGAAAAHALPSHAASSDPYEYSLFLGGRVPVRCVFRRPGRCMLSKQRRGRSQQDQQRTSQSRSSPTHPRHTRSPDDDTSAPP